MSTYTCPLCGYRTTFGNPASIALHERVSHSGAAPIMEVRAACVVHRMGADYRCTACGISESDAHYRGHSISGYDAS